MSRRKKLKEGRDVITCGHKWKCRCEHHDRACIIPISFPAGDSRAIFVAEMSRIGAGHHTPESEHRCHLCEAERQEGRRPGWYAVDPKDGKVKPRVLVERLTKEREEKKRDRAKTVKNHQTEQ